MAWSLGLNNTFIAYVTKESDLKSFLCLCKQQRIQLEFDTSLFVRALSRRVKLFWSPFRLRVYPYTDKYMITLSKTLSWLSGLAMVIKLKWCHWGLKLLVDAFTRRPNHKIAKSKCLNCNAVKWNYQWQIKDLSVLVLFCLFSPF